jgi:hypothetical protein
MTTDYTKYKYGVKVLGDPWRIGVCQKCHRHGLVTIHESGQIQVAHSVRIDRSPAQGDVCTWHAGGMGLTIGEAALLAGRSPMALYAAKADGLLTARLMQWGRVKLHFIEPLELRRYILADRGQGKPRKEPALAREA